MIHALCAAPPAVDQIQSRTSSNQSSSNVREEGSFSFSFLSISWTSTQLDSSAGFTPPSSSPFGQRPGGPQRSQMSSETLNMLVASQGQSSNTLAPSSSHSSSLKDLFSQIDIDGDGKINKSEFESVLGAGGTNLAQADEVFSKLDKNGDCSVSLSEMSSVLRGAKGHHSSNHFSIADMNSAKNSAPLSRMLQGASSASVTNADGSTTTSVTYADGSRVAITSPASGSSSNVAISSYNFIEQMIKIEAEAIAPHSTVSVSA